MSRFRFQFNKNLRRLISQLYIRDNCHPFKASLLVWVQLPLWISLSLALRNLSLDQSSKLTEDSGSHGESVHLSSDLCVSVQRSTRTWQQEERCGSPTSHLQTPRGSCRSAWDSPTCSPWRRVRQQMCGHMICDVK